MLISAHRFNNQTWNKTIQKTINWARNSKTNTTKILELLNKGTENLNFINVYAPDTGKSNEETDPFYGEI